MNRIPEGNYLIGISCVIVCSLTSGFAGVYCEKIMKKSNHSVWIHTIQMSVWSILLSFIGICIYDMNKIIEKGFFFSYDYLVWLCILVQLLSGFIVIYVIIYADRILKGFATSISIIISSIISMILFNFRLSLNFILGSITVILSSYMYGKAKVEKEKVDQLVLPKHE